MIDAAMQQRQQRCEQILSRALAEAKRLGATAAEAGVSTDAGLAVTVRLGEVETVEHTRDNGLGVTVYFGTRKGSASTSDLSPEALEETVRAACNIARFTAEDPCAGLAEAELMAREVLDLDLYHPWEIGADRAIELALECEGAALALDERLVNSEGASFNAETGLSVYANSHGFLGGYPSSRYSLSCALIAQQGEEMQRDYWYSLSRCGSELEPPARIGERAATRALARLGSRRLPTCRAPVIFQAEVAGSLLRSLISAIRGASLYRRASFLVDKLGSKIFPDFVRIHENPHLLRGLASSSFDAEGVATRARDLVGQGILLGYVLDSYSARKLGLQTTGNAGGVRNLSLDSGQLDLDGLIREMDRGLLVTELMGQGINLVTGDYSRGAAGFWVEQGAIQYPVEEITIAGNLSAMFERLAAVGTDVDRRGGVYTGSCLIDGLTIAGV